MSEIVPVVDEGLGNSSYLIDLGDGRALVLDPTRDPRRYLALAGRRHLDLAYTVETHLHADFVSGSRELAARGATVVAPAAAGLAFDHRPLGDGDELDLGGLTLKALATPGHTPEHLAYVLSDGDRPVALFSGGSLLPDAVARTDLVDPEQTEPLARSLWRALQERVLALPDELPVYPTHGAGSFCSTASSGERVTTIGREKAANPLLAAPDEDAFVKLLLGSYGPYPPYFLRLREVNRRGPAVHGPYPSLPAELDVPDVDRLVAAGAWVVDVRPVDAFAAGHIPGAVSIALRPGFATWLGWVVPAGVPLVFVLDPDQDRTELVHQTYSIGVERLAGELGGGMQRWRSAGRPVRHIPLIEGASAGCRAVLDVRQRSEFERGHIPGAHNVELGNLAADREAVAAMVDLDDLARTGVTVACGHGERAMTGASLLARHGQPGVAVLRGGTAEWVASGRPLEHPR